MSNTTSVLYDHPGPRARIRNRILTVVFGVAILALLWWIYRRFDEAGQWDGNLWRPFGETTTWTQFILSGLRATLFAAAAGMALSLAFGVVFSVGRLSDHWWIRIPCGAVVEFFRAVPLLLMIFFIFYAVPFLIKAPVSAFWAVVIGLTLYNGSVLAEAFRAGIRAVPRGQSEAAYALGMRKTLVMRHILVPQAARSMLPVIVSQLVVLLKDTALGFIIAYAELLQAGFKQIPPNYHNNLIQAGLVVAVIYIAINMALSRLATLLERRSRRSRKSAATTMGTGTGAPPAPGMAATSSATGASA